ncbi:uncharacterized protein LTR77_007876 [Saxophila tyrrhenica]|uniref:Uncharacterized protein n=1 Tax=Saxophila tyrrhenica TaxID=1690608 RepID=A0AAV9P3R6_9PEZI|nr:hypothetical protein LTR77_007876 [Saxophila tyrrhenica]
MSSTNRFAPLAVEMEAEEAISLLQALPYYGKFTCRQLGYGVGTVSEQTILCRGEIPYLRERKSQRLRNLIWRFLKSEWQWHTDQLRQIQEQERQQEERRLNRRDSGVVWYAF